MFWIEGELDDLQEKLDYCCNVIIPELREECARTREAKEANDEAEKKVFRVEQKVAEMKHLAEGVEEFQIKLKATEVGREKALARRKEVLKMAEQVAEDSFKNAISQVRCLNPGADLIIDGVDKECEVHQGKVVMFSKDRSTFEVGAEPGP